MSRSWRSRFDLPAPPAADVKLRAGPLIRASAQVYRHNAVPILLTAVVVFAPVAAFEAFVDEVLATRTRDLLGLEGIEAAAASIMGVIASLLAVLFFEGVVERFAAVEHRGHPRAHPIEVLADLPYGRLVAADLLITAGILAGLLLCLLPGLFVLVLFSLATPIVNMERRGVVWSLHRSYRLVRGNFFRVAVVVVGGIAFAEVVGSGLEDLAHTLHLGQSGEFAAVLASDVVVEPVITLPIVVTTFILSGLLTDADSAVPAP